MANEKSQGQGKGLDKQTFDITGTNPVTGEAVEGDEPATGEGGT